MSRKSERFKTDGENALNQNDHLRTVQEVHLGGGALTANEKNDLRSGQRERIEMVPIDKIVPDPRQPRRAMPSRYRGFGLDGLIKWVQDAGDYTGTHPDTLIKARDKDQARNGESVDQDADEETDVKVPPEIAGALRLCALARDIAERGLTNPVTVVQDGNQWLLETGERRWLAYHLLEMAYDDPDRWGRIPARVVDRFDVWRQASENNVRDDLNAIGKARQYAILVMDLIGIDEFKAIDTFEHEVDFYAQVAKRRMPHGKGDEIAAAMGYSSRQRASQFKKILSLHPVVWEKADDIDVPEAVLRNLPSNPATALKAIKRWEAEQMGQKRNSVDISGDARTMPAWWSEDRIRTIKTNLSYVQNSAHQPEARAEVRRRLQVLRDEVERMLEEMDGE